MAALSPMMFSSGNSNAHHRLPPLVRAAQPGSRRHADGQLQFFGSNVWAVIESAEFHRLRRCYFCAGDHDRRRRGSLTRCSTDAIHRAS
jgi:hypothetical protein